MNSYVNIHIHNSFVQVQSYITTDMPVDAQLSFKTFSNLGVWIFGDTGDFRQFVMIYYR